LTVKLDAIAKKKESKFARDCAITGGGHPPLPPDVEDPDELEGDFN
jgi:hypothetical protein